MTDKIGRNDPCPCGSGKKYKNCCINKPTNTLKLKHKVTVLSKPKEAPNLMNRAFGEAIEEPVAEKSFLVTEAFPETSAPPPGLVSKLGLAEDESPENAPL